MASSLQLPIDGILPDVAKAVNDHACAVVLAAPGAGKTTRIPPALIEAPWLRGQKIVMLEPRRLAARMAAARMASERGEALGETVGFRVRLESKVSARTRIEVVTEGILTRRLQSDPELAGTGLLIFDEFHERSLDADLGLALALDIQRALRPDLRILVMSATLDEQGVAALLGNAPVIASAHRPFPVTTRYLEKPPSDDTPREMTALIKRALAEEAGSVLAFLPGEGEIRRVQEALEQNLPNDVRVAALFGALPPDEQQRAVDPPPAGIRKVVLATTIAETSLTIEGVRIVVDCGFKRAPRFDARRGMTELTTVRVSKASAEQRRGRAGRLGPGVCYRLWTEPEDRALVPYDEPEMRVADLAPLALDLAAWGVADPLALAWMTPPPAGAYAQASDLLKRLNAVDADARITAEGKAMAALPLHPRLAHMVHRGAELGHAGLAADIAALLSERDILMGARDPDLRLRVEVLQGKERGASVHRGGLARVRAAAKQIRGIAKAGDKNSSAENTGILLALAYPDRIAQRRGPGGKFRLSGGGSAAVAETDALAAQEYLAVGDLDGAARDARIFLAAPVTRAELEEVFAADIADVDEVRWDARAEAIQASRQKRLGALVLEEKPLRDDADPALMQGAMIAGARSLGIAALPWTEGARNLQARVAFLKQAQPDQPWPDVSDDVLLTTLEDWLAPYLSGVTRRSHLAQIDLMEALRALLPWPLPQKLDPLAPTHLAVPSGSHIAVDYAATGPALYVKLQEVFGLADTPTVAGGRVAVTLHLLSPARRPIAVTRDLRSFWRNVYPQVRGEMRGAYPRHIWPEDPMSAQATKRSIKPRGT